VLVSQSAHDSSSVYAELVHPARFLAVPSIAYRLARVAAGDGVAALSLSSPCSWDYAAGHALLLAVGGVLLDEQGREVAYSATGESATQACFGGSPAVVAELCRRDWPRLQGAAPEPPSASSLVRPQQGRKVANAGMLARAQGCLLGQLAGDSLGGLVEFRDPESIREEYPNGVRELRDGGTWDNLAGQPTDDSEMALMLARMLGEHGRYDAGKALDAYVHWWPRAWDRGGTLRQALREASSVRTTAERLEQVQQHANRNSQSNGCLMRISPLGIFAARSPVEAAAWARQDSQLTHPNPVCQESCAVFVAAVATAIGQKATAHQTYEAALAEASRPGVQASVRMALQDAASQRPADYVTQMGWVLIALQNAFYQLLHAPSLEEGVVDTIAQGGDTDTTAAIAGALLGAVHGRAGIPARWLHTLLSCRPLSTAPTRHPQPMEFWPVDALELAEAVLARGLQVSSALSEPRS
jgi:ADP-ribosylglycohydrolase